MRSGGEFSVRLGTPLEARRIDPSGAWRLTSDEAGLETIFDDGVNPVVWHRGAPELADTTRLVDHPRRLMRPVRVRGLSARQIARLLDLDESSAFAADVARLTDLFAALTDACEVGIRIEATEHQICPKWHTDRVGLRLMTTYAGPGTEWLDGENTRRAAPGDVLVAKGALWPNTHGACVHRSPDPQGVTRVLLTLDEIN
jgi:hypothetical protein